ncbi:2-on-2 hemoglobin [Corchorus olitorius]|uniref:2-on-2 hemoglobin n=1 Tax=Corchorus olitorius TaxID=93759 RepID=A0A1R3JU55_9ROSI|nr:2-on-2 hemoglobin [Corchorus olitorius]
MLECLFAMWQFVSSKRTSPDLSRSVYSDQCMKGIQGVSSEEDCKGIGFRWSSCIDWTSSCREMVPSSGKGIREHPRHWHTAFFLVAGDELKNPTSPINKQALLTFTLLWRFFLLGLIG